MSERRARGSLVLVSTPIGNLGDMTERAVRALRDADVIACEDTRRTGGLLSHLGIAGTRMVVVNEHTEVQRIPDLLEVLDGGGTVAVVSDAGTPGVSDPGERIARAAIDAGHEVTATPGASAAVMALTISGMATGRWAFEGFLPRSGSARTERLGELAKERRTAVLYEAPHRLGRTLADLVQACGPDRAVVIARELTKLHEEVWRGTLGEAAQRASEREARGEHVLVLAGAPAPGPATDDQVRAALRACLAAGLDKKAAIAEVAGALKVPKRAVYALALTV
jgi:16S rRNA (cytidine1402-2'-O)-methyltransferase